MKKFLSALLCAATILLLCGCAAEPPAQIAATTLPVYEFTQSLMRADRVKLDVFLHKDGVSFTRSVDKNNN